MMVFLIFYVYICVLSVSGNLVFENVSHVPNDFLIGVSCSAYQTEGAWNEDGKGESMWDYYVHNNASNIWDHTNGDIAANSYHLYKQDVEILADLGVDAYRFSIAWTRILPRGTPDFINPKGVAHYNKLINELLDRGITPFVTMYHWDLPQVFSEKGGWLNRDVVDWYGDYARVLYKLFGDRVKFWLTINEPHIHCYFGYGYGLLAPGVHSPGDGYYECSRNLLLGHARAYHIYDKEFRKEQKGEVGIVNSLEWGMIEDPRYEDALEDFRAFQMHYFMDPIFSPQGNYPLRVIDRVASASAAQGYMKSRLPALTADEVAYLRGTSDFLGLNHYTSKYIYRNASVDGMYEVPSHDDDVHVGWYMDPSWPVGLNYWTADYPQGFLDQLRYLHRHFPGVNIYITENGIGSGPGLADDLRVQYMRHYLAAALQAKTEGVPVRGYFAWTLVDGFEWAAGYTMRFGIYELDHGDPGRRRVARKSAHLLRQIAHTRTVGLPAGSASTAVARSVPLACVVAWLLWAR